MDTKKIKQFQVSTPQIMGLDAKINEGRRTIMQTLNQLDANAMATPSTYIKQTLKPGTRTISAILKSTTFYKPDEEAFTRTRHLVGLAHASIALAIETRDLHMLKDCIKWGADTRKFVGALPLLHKTVERNWSAAVDILCINKCGIDTPNQITGMTALHLAAQFGYLDCIETLLAHGANIDAQDRLGQNPLMHALANSHWHASKLLIMSRHIVNTNNKTALLIACESGAPSDIVTGLLESGDRLTPICLDMAARNEDEDLVCTLLGAGADPNQKGPTGETPLFRAVRYGNYSLAQILLEGGADKNMTNKQGLTAWQIAQQQDLEDVAKLIKEW